MEERGTEAVSKKLKEDSLVRIKEKKTRWITKTIAEEGPRDVFLHVTLTETIQFLVILLIITTIAFGSMSTSMFYLTKIMRNEFVDKEFSTTGGRGITFDDVHSAADFWAYLEHVVSDSFYWDYWYDHENPIAETGSADNNVVYENKLLGVPRLRQVKVRNDSCQISGTFQKSVDDCYGDYSIYHMNKKPFGPENGTAWVYSELDHSQFPFTWEPVFYLGGYYQDFSTTRNDTAAIIEDLKANLWITRGTRAVFLDFTVYNANMNFFCVIQLIFEYPSTGGVLTSYQVNTLKLLRYTTNFDYFIFGLEIIFFAQIIYLTVEEVREMVYLKLRYLKRFWNYVDLATAILTYAGTLTAIYRQILLGIALDSYEHDPAGFTDFYKVATVHIMFNKLLAIVLFLNYIKLFKYITFNKMMAQLNNTLKNCANDVAGFSVMFFIIFIAFAELGYLLFGTQVTSFSSFGISMFTLLRTILGDFDYGEIEEVDKILAPLYFLSFIILVFFVLLNMFLAIISDTYTDVKTELTVAPDEMQMQQYLKRGYYNLLRMCKLRVEAVPKGEIKNEFDVTIEEIRGALKKCGFNDLEIEMFFSKYNVDQNAKLGTYTTGDLLRELEAKPYADSGYSRQERRTSAPKTPDGAPLVAINDFIGQQKKLDDIEEKIEALIEQVQDVLNKLGSLENVKRTPV